jgi:very-short-patch-repair endonuclease
MIGSFILDFYCSRLLLGIEIDGPSHNTTQIYDRIRTKKMWDYGIKIVRYQNDEVFYNLDQVAQKLSRELEARAKELTNPFEFL